MILPPLANDCNERFPTMAQPFFDDHNARRDHYLQQRLKQHAPATLDGGRAILWFCRLCQKPWYELGHMTSFVRLSKSQLAKVAQQLGAEVRATSSFPVSICPLCAALHLGGMPRIEEYPNGQGYRLMWEAITSPHARLFCIIHKWNVSSILDMVREVCSVPCDVLAAPMEHVKSVLAWLKTLADPGKEEATMLHESIDDHMNRYNPPQPGFSWCGYAWKAQCPALGQVLVAPGMTFPTASICSPSLLVACWRQIAREMEKVLAC
jgi:hypothetical protein